MIKLYPLLITLILMACSSCGKDAGHGQNENPIEVQEVLQGKYKAFLRPINSQAAGFIPSGATEITVTNDEVQVITYLDDASAVSHIQSIHEGVHCPKLSHDRNGDGFIDQLETEAISGKVLIPLDGDLSSQSEGAGQFPMGKSFTYERKALLSHLLEDLYASSSTENTKYKKLPQGTPFNLTGKVVLIHGTADIQRLPESIASAPGLARNLSIPIACGIIKRVGN